MKVYYNVDIFATNPAGIVRYASEILQYLKLHFEVIPVSFQEGLMNDPLREFIEREFPKYRFRANRYILRGLGIPVTRIFFISGFNFYNTRWKEQGCRVSKIIRELIRPFMKIETRLCDFLCFKYEDRSVLFSPYEAIPKRYRSDKVLIVQMLHDIIPLRMESVFNGSKFFTPIVQSVFSSDVALVNSAFTRDDFLNYVNKFDSNRLFVTELATARHISRVECAERISKVRSKYGISSEAEYILSLSTIEPRKNHKILLHAWNKIFPLIAEKKIQLVFAGKKGWGDKFHSELSDLAKDANSLVLTGFVDDEDLGALYSGSLFSVYPSLYEGFGLPVLESMSCGRFCVASNTTSIPEVVGENLPMVNPESVDEIAGMMLRLMCDRSLLDYYNKQAFENSRRFSWEETGRKTLEAINEGYQRKWA